MLPRGDALEHALFIRIVRVGAFPRQLGDRALAREPERTVGPLKKEQTQTLFVLTYGRNGGATYGEKGWLRILFLEKPAVV